MKSYPEPNGRIWDILETSLLSVVVALLCVCVYLAVDLARIVLEVL